jgi:hypothetical protein
MAVDFKAFFHIDKDNDTQELLYQRALILHKNGVVITVIL